MHVVYYQMIILGCLQHRHLNDATAWAVDPVETRQAQTERTGDVSGHAGTGALQYDAVTIAKWG